MEERDTIKRRIWSFIAVEVFSRVGEDWVKLQRLEVGFVQELERGELKLFYSRVCL